MSDVEIFWPAGVPTEGMFEAQATLQEAGNAVVCRQQPVRRGPEIAVLVFVATNVLGPLLQGLFKHVGDSAWSSLRRFVHRALPEPDAGSGPVPNTLVFRSARGDEFVFTAALPEAAFRQAVRLEPGPEPGRWVWDQGSSAWLQFEQVDHHREERP